MILALSLVATFWQSDCVYDHELQIVPTFRYVCGSPHLLDRYHIYNYACTQVVCRVTVWVIKEKLGHEFSSTWGVKPGTKHNKNYQSI